MSSKLDESEFHAIKSHTIKCVVENMSSKGIFTLHPREPREDECLTIDYNELPELGPLNYNSDTGIWSHERLSSNLNDEEYKFAKESLENYSVNEIYNLPGALVTETNFVEFCSEPSSSITELQRSENIICCFDEARFHTKIISGIEMRELEEFYFTADAKKINNPTFIRKKLSELVEGIFFLIERDEGIRTFLYPSKSIRALAKRLLKNPSFPSGFPILERL